MQLAGEHGIALCVADQAGDVRPDGGVGENFGGDMDSAAQIIERAAGAGRWASGFGGALAYGAIVRDRRRE